MNGKKSPIEPGKLYDNVAAQINKHDIWTWNKAAVKAKVNIVIMKKSDTMFADYDSIEETDLFVCLQEPSMINVTNLWIQYFKLLKEGNQ